jgi:hypothetical protein
MFGWRRRSPQSVGAPRAGGVRPELVAKIMSEEARKTWGDPARIDRLMLALNARPAVALAAPEPQTADAPPPIPIDRGATATESTADDESPVEGEQS